jgi:hypothetical protein
VKHFRLPCVICLLLVVFLASRAQATFVTSAAAFGSPTQIIDFSQFSGPSSFGPGPVQVGGLVGANVVWSSSNSTTQGGAVIGDSLYNIIPNGSWNSGRVGFVGLNVTTGTMLLKFNGPPVGEVGAFLNYSAGSGPDVIISALASDGSVLESYDVNTLAPISTPGMLNAGAFRGITRPTADIFGFQVANSAVVLDNLTFGASSPEPSSVMLFSVGLLALASAYRRGKRRQVRAIATIDKR